MYAKRIWVLLFLSVFTFFSGGASADWKDLVMNSGKKMLEEKLHKKHQPTNFTPIVPTITQHDQYTVDIDYGFYLVNYDCQRRGYNYVIATATEDRGSLPRYEQFSTEDALKNVGCESQFTAKEYKSPAGAPQYHRGHGNMSNLWDDREDYMEATNRMTNVVPQHGVQNTSGLWRELEMRVECSRDEVDTLVYVGNLWGNNTANDYFLRSHGVETPDYLWRIHVYKDRPNEAYAWIFPNDGVAMPKDDPKYRISLRGLLKNISAEYKLQIPSSWVDGPLKDPHQRHNCQQR